MGGYCGDGQRSNGSKNINLGLLELAGVVGNWSNSAISLVFLVLFLACVMVFWFQFNFFR